MKALKKMMLLALVLIAVPAVAEADVVRTSRSLGNSMMGASYTRTVQVERDGYGSSSQDASRVRLRVFKKSFDVGGLDGRVEAQGLAQDNPAVSSRLNLRLRGLVVPLHGKVFRDFTVLPLVHLQLFVSFVPVTISAEVVVSVRVTAHDVTRVWQDGPLGSELGVVLAFSGMADAGVGVHHIAVAGLFAHLDLLYAEIQLATEFSKDLTRVIPRLVLGSKVELILGVEAKGPFGIGFKVGRSIAEYEFVRREIPMGQAEVHDTDAHGH